jgi:euchromatic histone-lysine N-methyltransferase
MDDPGCNGTGNCLTCHCRRLFGEKRSLTYVSEGRINLMDLDQCVPFIIECDEHCGCNSRTCPNRAVQNRWKWKLIVVRTGSTHQWGVKTLDFIPSGSFVCEFLGRVISTKVQHQAVKAIYMERDLGQNPEYNLDAYHVPAKNMHVINSVDVGNVSSFIEPRQIANLVPVSVSFGRSLTNHRIGLFASRDIYPNEELSFHPNYGFNFDKHLGKQLS